MSKPTPSITINVDPTNPGQFFACCGLLELADRFWPGAEGWFGEGGRVFHVACGGELQGVLEYLVKCSPTEVLRIEPSGLEVRPIFAPLALSFEGKTERLIIDAWTRIVILKGVAQVIGQSPWNFWSGHQTPLGIWIGLQESLIVQLAEIKLAEATDPLAVRLFQKGRFGFDCGPAWSALDVGFSPNEQGMEVESSPLVELLAAVGVQRFRPDMNESRDAFYYYTWHRACSPNVAAVSMSGAIRDRAARRLRASVITRGQYGALSKAFFLQTGEKND